jgi:hypothetical protein
MTKQNKTKLIVSLILFLASGLFLFNSIINSADAGWVKVRTGQKTVTTKGTPVQMPSLVIPSTTEVVVKAKNVNTGKITVGYSSATALNSGTDFFSLYPGESIHLKIYNLNLLWIDGENGEGVEYLTEFD